MNKLSISFLLYLGSILFLAPGCKKLSSDTSLLVLNVRSNFGSDSLSFSKSYLKATGDSISFSRATFYISGIQLISTSGTSVSVPGYFLITPSTGQNIIAGNVPIGTYKSVSFNVGIDRATNDGASASYTSGALSPQVPVMHFATDAQGYIFMDVEGKIDSAANGSGPNKSFSYHIGSDALLQTVNLPDHSVSPYTAFTATGTQLLTINLLADFSKLLQNVNVINNPVTNTYDNAALADSLAAHIPAMFSYQN